MPAYLQQRLCSLPADELVTACLELLATDLEGGDRTAVRHFLVYGYRSLDQPRLPEAIAVCDEALEGDLEPAERAIFLEHKALAIYDSGRDHGLRDLVAELQQIAVGDHPKRAQIEAYAALLHGHVLRLDDDPGALLMYDRAGRMLHSLGDVRNASVAWIEAAETAIRVGRIQDAKTWIASVPDGVIPLDKVLFTAHVALFEGEAEVFKALIAAVDRGDYGELAPRFRGRVHYLQSLDAAKAGLRHTASLYVNLALDSVESDKERIDASLLRDLLVLRAKLAAGKEVA